MMFDFNCPEKAVKLSVIVVRITGMMKFFWSTLLCFHDSSNA